MTVEGVSSITGADKAAGARPQSEEALRSSELRFRTIFEQSSISTQILSPDGRTIAVNRAWEELWGVTLEQIGDYNILEDQQLVEKGIMPYVERGFAGEATEIPPVKYEPDETIPGISSVPYRWVAASIYPVIDVTGTVREVVLIHDDITERVRVEEAIRESEERFRAVFYGAPVGISLVDRDGRYVSVNPVRQEMLGYSEDELIGRHYLDVTHPDDVEYDEQINREARELRRDHYQLEKRFLRKDGSVRWTRLTISTVRGLDGEVQYSVSIAEDITDLKKSEEERAMLFELERIAWGNVEKLAAERAAILSQIADGIIIADPAGRITFVNERARAIHGVAELGVPVDQYTETYGLLTMDGKPYPPTELPLARAVLHGETIVDAEWVVRRPDGTEVIAQGSATPVLAEDGTRLGAVLTIRDVTEQFNLERQKDDFLSAAAHDLRTPLTTIKGRVELLRRRADSAALDPERLLDELRRIDASATRMVTLINELLDVANIQLGRPLALVPRPVDLVELARTVASEQGASTAHHTIQVQTELPELVATLDATRIERVLANLVSNAVKYSPDGGEITIGVAEELHQGIPRAVLWVRDQGIGIPADDLPQIFDRFHRGENVVGKIAGTGIGLAAVREIVDRHGGDVSVKSPEGVGTTFTVTLPL